MRKVFEFGLLILLLNLFTAKASAQPQVIISEVGNWKCEKDLKSRWEFKSDGRLVKTYQGTDARLSYSYMISETKPACPNVQLAVEPNVKYLKTINDKYGNVDCFYIYALNEQRFTVMDALTGHIFPFIRVE